MIRASYDYGLWLYESARNLLLTNEHRFCDEAEIDINSVESMFVEKSGTYEKIPIDITFGKLALYSLNWCAREYRNDISVGNTILLVYENGSEYRIFLSRDGRHVSPTSNQGYNYWYTIWDVEYESTTPFSNFA